MRTWMWLAAVTALGMIGCGGGTTTRTGSYDCQFSVDAFGYVYGVETDWVVNVTEPFPPGRSYCVEGPYSSPDGADIVFDITDTFGDDMDVSVVPNGASCDGSKGYGSIGSTSWAGSLSSDTGYGHLPGLRWQCLRQPGRQLLQPVASSGISRGQLRPASPVSVRGRRR